MASSVLAPGRRRLASLIVVAVLGAAFALPGAAVATTTTVSPDEITAAEAAMVKALNADRTELGLVRVVVDSRLMAIARARSADMVAKDYFSHTQPDGRNVFDILTAQHLTWYNAGEIIAWNNYPMSSTVAAADYQWMHSPGHKSIIISTGYNYIGVGLAIEPSTGKKLWTAVYMKGPDRTAARATAGTASIRAGATADTRHAKLTWSGYDPRLQVLTAGLRNFTIQRRMDDGAFVTAVSSTTLTYTTFTVRVGHRYEFRIAARDRNGNRGSWSTKIIDLR
ncbi:MAG: hypothetical protein H0V73_11225 [Chloroflexi bacterium]|nr:hypothetical protein [Chloroflexota bacterium]